MMNVSKPRARIVLEGVRLDPPPIWLMRQAGRYLPEYQEVRRKAGGFMAMALDPAYATEVTLQPIARFDMDVAIIFADILLIPHAWGLGLSFEEGVGPKLRAVASSSDLDALSWDGWRDRVAPVSETVRRTRAALPAEKAVFGFAGAPWTVATYMAAGGSDPDQSTAREWAWRDSESLCRLLGMLAEATAQYLIDQIDAGADAVQIFESHAGAASTAHVDSLLHEPVRQIVETVRAARPDTPIIGFPRGYRGRLEDYVAATGVTALGVDEHVGRDVVNGAPDGMALQGNADAQAVRMGGEALTQEVRRALAQFENRPHIMNLGHGVGRHTPPDHVGEVVRLTRSGA